MLSMLQLMFAQYAKNSIKMLINVPIKRQKINLNQINQNIVSALSIKEQVCVFDYFQQHLSGGGGECCLQSTFHLYPVNIINRF